MNEDESKIILFIGGVLLIGGFITGSVYRLATYFLTTFGDCSQTVSEDVVVSGLKILFTPGAKPALAEGVKIALLLLGLAGLVIGLRMGVVQYIHRRQTSRRRAYSSGSSKQYSGPIYTVSLLALVVGVSVATSMAMRAQTACVGDSL